MSRKIVLLSLIVVTILVISSLAVLITSVTPASAQQAPSSPIVNWEYVNADQKATNYSPQRQMGKDNVASLELKWLFPYPPASTFARFQAGRPPNEGAGGNPIVANGISYTVSNMRSTYAFNATTGRQVWSHTYQFNFTGRGGAAERGLPITAGASHFHGLNYLDGITSTSARDCLIQAIDAKDGKERFTIRDICLNVEGNLYDWPTFKGPGLYGSGGHPPVVYKTGKILVTMFNGQDVGRGGRSFVDGYDISQTPPKQVWRTFLQPPGEGDAEWAIKACSNVVGGWYFSYKAWKEQGKLAINCKDVPRENVINDWGVPKHYMSSVAASWGQAPIDEETGLLYFGTGDQSMFLNGTYNPGPNLFVASTIAIDAKTGKIVWWFQYAPRDMLELDNPFNHILGKVVVGGQERKAVFKMFAPGLFFALDGATGQPLWIFEDPALATRIDPDGAKRGRTAGVPNAPPNTQDGFWLDIMNNRDMQVKRWQHDPLTTPVLWDNIRAGRGGIALDPESNTLFVPIRLSGASAFSYGPVPKEQGFTLVTTPARPGAAVNFTAWAIDANTGKPKWRYFTTEGGSANGMIVSNGLVYFPSTNGDVYIIDASSGELVYKKFLGVGLLNQPTIGTDAKGRPMFFINTGSTLGPVIPGALMAFGLPDRLPQPQVITKEVIKEVPKEVVKTVTVETIGPITYAAIGIAVIAIVIAAVTFARRKRV